jgi:hypothetical protein
MPGPAEARANRPLRTLHPPRPQVLASLQDEATLADTMKSVAGIAADPSTLRQVRGRPRHRPAAPGGVRASGAPEFLLGAVGGAPGVLFCRPLTPHTRTNKYSLTRPQVADTLSSEVKGTVDKIRGSSN